MIAPPSPMCIPRTEIRLRPIRLHPGGLQYPGSRLRVSISSLPLRKLLFRMVALFNSRARAKASAPDNSQVLCNQEFSFTCSCPCSPSFRAISGCESNTGFDTPYLPRSEPAIPCVCELPESGCHQQQKRHWFCPSKAPPSQSSRILHEDSFELRSSRRVASIHFQWRPGRQFQNANIRIGICFPPHLIQHDCPLRIVEALPPANTSWQSKYRFTIRYARITPTGFLQPSNGKSGSKSAAASRLKIAPIPMQ